MDEVSYRRCYVPRQKQGEITKNSVTGGKNILETDQQLLTVSVNTAYLF
jgi:hypothetical protein